MPSVTCDLSIIIVNWNTRDLLAACLESVIGDRLSVNGHQSSAGDNRSLFTETIVVDNASSDGSAAMVRERFPWVRLIESRENLGFAAGNNLALREARGDTILLLNPDTVVTEGAILRLWQVLTAQPDIGIAGAQLLNADGSLQMSTGVFPSLWSELPLINRRLRPVRRTFAVNTPTGETTVHAVDWVSGAALMIKREVVEAIGPLDEDFWLYTEETDWCYRARAAGWDVVVVPDARIYHLARAASRQRFVVTMLHFYQSRVRFVYKHYGHSHAWTMKRILYLKAIVWRRDPHRSPLHKAYVDLPNVDIMSAYSQLAECLKLPVMSFLELTW